MPFAIELYFDEVAEAAVRHIWQAIADAGFKSPMQDAGYRPHISLAVYDDDALDLDGLQQTLKSFVGTLPPFFVDLSNIGIFPTNEGIIFLGATVTQTLQRIHADFHAAFAEFAGDLRPYYQVNHWVPHCTLAYGLSPDEIAAILLLGWQAPLPLRAQACQIGIAQVSPMSCEFIGQHPLKKRTVC